MVIKIWTIKSEELGGIIGFIYVFKKWAKKTEAQMPHQCSIGSKTQLQMPNELKLTQNIKYKSKNKLLLYLITD